MRKFLYFFVIIYLINYSVFAKNECVNNILDSSSVNKIDSNQKNIKVNQANLFFDTSQNMIGFINSPSSSYKLFVSELIKKTPLFSENQTFQNYFKNIDTIDVNNIGGVTTNKKFYQCPSDIASGDCHSIKTKLSSVLTAVSQQTENQLSIIVTDLFLRVEEILTKKNRDKIAKPLANALQRGDAIGIFGIQSAYEGKIFGICPNNTQTKRTTYSGATSRPFFVILIGSKDVILNFKAVMDEQVIPLIGSEKVEFNLFTNDIINQPYYGAAWPSSNFNPGNGVIKGDVLEGDRSDILEYIIQQKNQPLDILIDLSKIQTPYTLALSDFTTVTQGYMQISEKGSCSDQWFDIGKHKNITYFDNHENSIVTFDIFNKTRQLQADDQGNYAMQFNRNFNYIFKIDFRAKNIANNSNTVWMEDPEWTFSCEQADSITDPENGRTKFPVLNLDTFYDLLEQVQKENFSETSISKMNLAVHMSK